MANYAIFDEQYYLSQYPWLKPAIDAGIIKSGREHFEKFGQAAGITKISRYFDEDTYLAQNQDIAPFVRTANNQNRPFASGLDHFIQYGYEEGRTAVSSDYDEAFYTVNNRDLQPFIQNGTFKNGYQHFIQFGAKEDRFGTSFFESRYLSRNPDIVPFVNSGALKTGREHYFNFGKNEPAREATFVGTSGNDILTGIGAGYTNLIGVEVGLSSTGYRNYESDGSNEFDTLIGSSGQDGFELGERLLSGTFPLYIGPGFATIRNFTKGQDYIVLTGYSLDTYNFVPVNNNRDLAIQTNGLPVVKNGISQTSSGDTIAVIENGGNLGFNVLFNFSGGSFFIN
ncbi:calcium-binding protein [Microcoleus sp. S28C3]|uniref:calcium-binding protein n=1 Tax=Microcoleus sp. S28C3 TaxID=3055414 RepID=UPI002FD4D07F